jgi:cytochrome c biogenesis protein CcdA
MINFILGVAVILGVMVAPFMTMGAVMYHYGHETLGIVLGVIGVINMLIKLND